MNFGDGVHCLLSKEMFETFTSTWSHGTEKETTLVETFLRCAHDF